MQNIKDWPSWIKICFGVIISALVLAGLIELPKLNEISGGASHQDTSSELLNVNIIVYSYDTNIPLQNVEVRFISKGSPEVRRTNTDGFTQISIPPRDAIDIFLMKEGFLPANHTINLRNDPEKPKPYYLVPIPQKP